jgi:hypothetical protein
MRYLTTLSSSSLLIVGVVFAACSSSGNGSSSSPDGGSSSSPDGGSSSSPDGGSGGMDSGSLLDSSSADGGGGADSGGADGGSDGDTGSGSVPTVTIAQITDPTAPGFVTDTQVRISGVVATSIKFLSTKSSSGSCSWGVFLSTASLTTAAPHSAILALNDGAAATAPDGGGPTACPVLQEGQAAGDLFPDDTAPGDVFDIVGLATSYVPAGCGAPDAGAPNNSNVAEYELTTLSSVSRTSRGAQVPSPHVFTASEAASLSAGQDATFLGAWGGALVTVQNVMAVEQGGSLLDAYGHLLLDDGIQVGEKLYYVGAVKTTDVCYDGPVFASAPTFTSVSGFAYLDYCTWGIDPRDKCNDLAPPSEDCASVADAGLDASAALVCDHAPVGGTP